METVIPSIEPPPSWSQFKKSWVSPNLPVKIKGAMNQWNCYRYNREQYLEHLKQLHGDTMVDICISSNDTFLGDARSDERSTISFGDFVDQKDNPSPTLRFYLCQIPIVSNDKKEAQSVLPLLQNEYGNIFSYAKNCRDPSFLKERIYSPG
jgi:hypothetical protein